MAENTKIEWADHTFNPWMGCTKVSPACDNCYAADMMDTRYGRVRWGAGEPRVRTKDWSKPRKWNRDTPGAFGVLLAHGVADSVGGGGHGAAGIAHLSLQFVKLRTPAFKTGHRAVASSVIYEMIGRL